MAGAQKAARAAAAVGLSIALAAHGQVVRPRPAPLPIIVVPGTVVVYPDAPVTWHGAIAHRPDTGAFGYSYDWPTAREAEISALDECGDPRCVVAVSFASGCGALAVGARGANAQRGATRAEAETRALEACADAASCRILVWACTR